MTRTALALIDCPEPAERLDLEAHRVGPSLQVAEEVIRTSFERFELKYWVPEEVARAAVLFACPYVIPDSFGDTHHKQRNTSLYLDTPEHEFLRLHVDSTPDRFKLRVRRYGDPPSGPAFFEVKRKVNAVIVKQRAKVPPEAVRPLLDGSTFELPEHSPSKDRRNLEAFLYLMTIYRATPSVLVSCMREAYVSPDREEDVRFTIDRDIVYQPALAPDFSYDPAAWMTVDGPEQHGKIGGCVIVEFKFRGAAPYWMAELVQRLAMGRQGYSKYVSALTRELGEDSPEERDAIPAWED